MNFAIARQPIYDLEKNIYGYEVYLRRADDLTKYPSDVPYNKATFIVAELIAEVGPKNISEGKPIFLNVTLDSILNRVLDLLPLDKVVFQIMKPQMEIGQAVYSQALKRIREFKDKSVLFCLTEDLYSGKYVDLFKLSDMVEFSITSITEEKIQACRKNGKKILVSRIETQDHFQTALKFADLLQGNYLGSPHLIREFEIAPFLKSTLIRMISALNNVQSVKEFADIVSSDVGMSAKLLRFVNSAYFTKRKEIKDLVQACAYLGMDNLKKFTLLVATNDYISVENPYLWKKSLIRAILAEEIMKKVKPSLANEAYIAGLFSLIDEILGVDKVEFLRDVGIDDEIIQAYTGENKELSSVLEKAIMLEETSEKDGEELDEIINKLSSELNISPVDLTSLLVEARTQAEEILKI